MLLYYFVFVSVYTLFISYLCGFTSSLGGECRISCNLMSWVIREVICSSYCLCKPNQCCCFPSAWGNFFYNCCLSLKGLTWPSPKVLGRFLEYTVSSTESYKGAGMRRKNYDQVKPFLSQGSRWISSGSSRKIIIPLTWHLDSLQRRMPTAGCGN